MIKQESERLKAVFRLLRPNEWIKNGVVFLAMIFGGRLLDAASFGETLIAAIAFCFASSAVYCLNDVRDADYDRRDPLKCSRPVASGALSPGTALTTGAVAAVLSMVISGVLLPLNAFWVIVAYLLLNVAYCLRLKNITLVDVIVVALGFVLRIVIGGITARVWISQWIVIMVFLLALFLALAKRRHEVMLVDKGEKGKGRKSVAGYTIPFLDITLGMLAAVIVVGYILYTLQPRTIEQFSTEYLYITALPVLCGLLRYLQLTIVDNRSGNPSKIIYSDRPLRLMAGLWLLLFICIIYV